MITYTVENWHDMKAEAAPLLERHWLEIAADKDEIPLAVDHESYDALADCGALHILVARKDGQMIGYYWAMVRHHLHYATTLFAFADIFYIVPEHRKGWVGYKLFTEMEKSLKARGVKKIFAGCKPWHDVGPIFDRLGYTVHETTYSKMIG